MSSLTVLETSSRSPRSRCQQGWFLLKAARENLFCVSLLASDNLLAIFDVPWLGEMSPQSSPSYSHDILPVCVSHKLPLFIRTSVVFVRDSTYSIMTS